MVAGETGLALWVLKIRFRGARYLWGDEKVLSAGLATALAQKRMDTASSGGIPKLELPFSVV